MYLLLLQRMDKKLLNAPRKDVIFNKKSKPVAWSQVIMAQCYIDDYMYIPKIGGSVNETFNLPALTISCTFLIYISLMSYDE